MSPPNRREPYAAFRYANFRSYTFGVFFAEIGEQMVRVAVGYEIFQRTHSPLALGFIGLSIWLPIFIFTLPGGAVADRYNRKAIVLACSLLFVLCAVGLALAPRASNPVAVMYGLLFMTGLTRAFNDPARRSLLPQLVPRQQFTNAITWSSNVFQVGSVAGPALGGMLYSVIGYSNNCLLVAAAELVFFGGILAIRQVPVDYKGDPVGLKSLQTGLKFVWKTKLILATITMDLFVVLLGGATAMLPAYADDVLHCGAAGYGWLQAAQSLGAFVASMLIAHRAPMKKAGSALLWAVAGFGAATVIFGVSRWFWLSFAMLVVAGALDLISVIVRSTLVQVLTPDSMRGRVNAVSAIFISSSNELGGFESGVAAHFLGLVPSVALGGVGSIIVVLAVIRIWPEVARLGPLHQVQKRLAPRRRDLKSRRGH